MSKFIKIAGSVSNLYRTSKTKSDASTEYRPIKKVICLEFNSYKITY